MLPGLYKMALFFALKDLTILNSTTLKVLNIFPRKSWKPHGMAVLWAVASQAVETWWLLAGFLLFWEIQTRLLH